MYKVPTETAPFENLAADFIIAAAKCAGREFYPLVYSSPLSARSPDLCVLWHPVYRRKNKAKLFFRLMFSAFVSILKGIRSFIPYRKVVAFSISGCVGDTLLVAGSNCVKKTEPQGLQTPYVKKEEKDCIFVFGHPGTCGRGEVSTSGPKIFAKLRMTMVLMSAGIIAYIRTFKSGTDSVLVFMIWIEWVLSMRWLAVYCLEKELSRLFKEHDIKKLGCVHEMHFYSRMLWILAAARGIKSFTVQHAEITEGKRWYFPYEKELDLGMKQPDIMYVFNNDIADMLRPYYKNAEFRLGCSSRYAGWKGAEKAAGRGDYFLFAGALAGFDNDVLFESIRKTLSELRKNAKVRLRLHRYAIIGGSDRKWLASRIKDGDIALSGDVPLKEDLKKAIVVAGMGTTVLEEALLMGRPVIHITNEDYLEYIDIEGVKGVKRIRSKDLQAGDILGAAGIDVDGKVMENKFGLNYPEVTYERLFE